MLEVPIHLSILLLVPLKINVIQWITNNHNLKPYQTLQRFNCLHQIQILKVKYKLGKDQHKRHSVPSDDK